MYRKVDKKFIEGLEAIVGKENVLTDAESLEQYKTCLLYTSDAADEL